MVDDTDYTKSTELDIVIDENYKTQINIPIRINYDYDIAIKTNFDCPVRISNWIRIGYAGYGAKDFGTTTGSDFTANTTDSYNGFDTISQVYKWVIVPRGHHDGQLITLQHFNQHSVLAEAIYIASPDPDGWNVITLDNNSVTSKYARLVWINQKWRILYTNGAVT